MRRSKGFCLKIMLSLAYICSLGQPEEIYSQVVQRGFDI
jgi:hypothetical protein